MDTSDGWPRIYVGSWLLATDEQVTTQHRASRRYSASRRRLWDRGDVAPMVPADSATSGSKYPTCPPHQLGGIHPSNCVAYDRGESPTRCVLRLYRELGAISELSNPEAADVEPRTSTAVRPVQPRCCSQEYETTRKPPRSLDPGAFNWRYRWDLNPRMACTITCFRDMLLRPLGHGTADELRPSPRARFPARSEDRQN